MAGVRPQVQNRPRHRSALGLPVRLRSETADLHRRVEDAVGLPDAVRTREDYADLLVRFHHLHTGFEQALAHPRWAAHWDAVAVDLVTHRRAHLLARDLARMGHPVGSRPPTAPGPFPPARTFSHALGWLYVLEGSSLGGPFISRAVRGRLGAVPTSFFDGDGRDAARAWRAVRQALTRFASGDDGAADDVVTGARQAFVAFGSHLAPDAAWQEDRP